MVIDMSLPVQTLSVLDSTHNPVCIVKDESGQKCLAFLDIDYSLSPVTSVCVSVRPVNCGVHTFFVLSDYRNESRESACRRETLHAYKVVHSEDTVSILCVGEYTGNEYMLTYNLDEIDVKDIEAIQKAIDEHGLCVVGKQDIVEQDDVGYV